MGFKMPPIIKDNAPIIIGGVLGVGFIMYILNKTGSGNNQSVQYHQPSAVQYAQSPQVIYSNANNQESMDSQVEIMQANLAAQSNAANNAAQLEFQRIQGDNTQKVGEAAMGIISALSMPTINAINSNNQADIAAITASVSALKAGAAYETIVPTGDLTNINAVNVSNNTYNPAQALSEVNYMGKMSPQYMQVYNNNTLTGIIESVNGTNKGYGVNNQGMVESGAGLASTYGAANAAASGQSWNAIGNVASNAIMKW